MRKIDVKSKLRTRLRELSQNRLLAWVRTKDVFKFMFIILNVNPYWVKNNKHWVFIGSF